MDRRWRRQHPNRTWLGLGDEFEGRDRVANPAGEFVSHWQKQLVDTAISESAGVERVLKAGGGELAEIGFNKAHSMGGRVFVVKVGVKHGRIVRRENDRNAMAKKLGKGMFF